MAFTFNNYATSELSKSPLNDIIENMLGGYEHAVKASYLQPGLAEQLQKSKLENKWYEPNMESQIGLRGAQAGHLGAMTEGLNISNPFLRQKLADEQQKRQFELQNPFFGQTGTSGDLGRLIYLQQMLKNNPELASQMKSQGVPSGGEFQSSIPSIQPQAQNPSAFDMNSLIKDAFSKVAHGRDKQFAPSGVKKLQDELREIESGRYPGTNELIPNKQLIEELAAPYREKLGGLKQGEHYIYDPETHEKIGMERPYTPKEKDTEVGRAFFNEVYPVINKGVKDFVGKGSIENFRKYANEYGKNEVATRKIDDLLLAQKLMSAGIVNEAATLNAGKTNMTYRNLAKSFPNSDIPKLIEQYEKGLVLPGEAFMKSGIRFNQMINQAQMKANGSVPALKTQFFHPEKYLSTKEEKSKTREEKSTHYTDSDIRATAAKYGISEEEVRKRLKKAKKNG